MIVDTHCHASSRWYEPIDTLLFNMDRCGVDRAVLVQLLGSTDSTDMAEAQRAHPDRFRYVAAIDPLAPDAIAVIEAAANEGAVGLRMRAAWRSPGDDPLALWRAVASSGLRVSMVGSASSFTDGELAEIALACPDLPIILEHLGGLGRPDVGDRDAALRAVIALSSHPNVMLKLPGLGQVAPRLPGIDAAGALPLDMKGVEPLLASILDAFGADRLMWGSDFPPVASREGYANALGWTRDLIDRVSPGAASLIFEETAARVFGF